MHCSSHTHRALMCALLASLLALCASPASAHKVLLSVYASGDELEGELGFSNGVMAAFKEVSITTADGTSIALVKTDADGFFAFKPTLKTAHRFHANLGAGHVVTAVVDTAELPGVSTSIPTPVARSPAKSGTAPQPVRTARSASDVNVSRPDSTSPGTPKIGRGTQGPAVNPMPATGRDSIASAHDVERLSQSLRQELRSIRRELAAYKEKNDLQTVLGGIGYILGLFGIGFYVAAMRTMKARNGSTPEAKRRHADG